MSCNYCWNQPKVQGKYDLILDGEIKANSIVVKNLKVTGSSSGVEGGSVSKLETTLSKKGILQNNTVYQLATLEDDITIKIPDTNGIYKSELAFSTWYTAPNFICESDVYWFGDDVTDNQFIPEGDKRYLCKFESDGVYTRCNVQSIKKNENYFPEYIEATELHGGQQYIDTKILVSDENENTNIKCVAEFQLTEYWGSESDKASGNYSGGVFGAQQSTNGINYSRFCIYPIKNQGSKKIQTVLTKGNDASGIMVNSSYDEKELQNGLFEKYEYVLQYKNGKGSASIGGITKSQGNTVSSFTNPYPIYIFTRSTLKDTNNPNEIINDPTVHTWGKLYSFKIYKGVNLDESDIIMDLKPCVGPTGAAGMYDTISKKVFYNSGTGTGDFTYPIEQSTYSLRRQVAEYGKMTETGVKRLYHVPSGFNGTVEEYANKFNYKKLIFTEKPQDEKYYSSKWVETDNELIVEWFEVEHMTEEV